MVTAVALVKLLPVMVTDCPPVGRPRAGEIDDMTGGPCAV